MSWAPPHASRTSSHTVVVPDAPGSRTVAPTGEEGELGAGHASCSVSAGLRVWIHTVWLHAPGCLRCQCLPHRWSGREAAVPPGEQQEGSRGQLGSRGLARWRPGLGPRHAFRDHRALFLPLFKQTLQPPSSSFLAPFSQVLQLIIHRQKMTSNSRNKSFWMAELLSALYMCPWESKGDALRPGSVIAGDVRTELRLAPVSVRGRLRQTFTGPAASGTHT